VPGAYSIELISGSSGQAVVYSYGWSLISAPAGSRNLLEPPQEPPASPSAKEYVGHVTLIKQRTDSLKTGHVSISKRVTDTTGQRAQKTRTKSNNANDRQAKTGHVTLIKAFD